MEKTKNFYPDCTERADGSRYYSEEYLVLMMQREYQRGLREGQRKEVHRVAVMWDGFKETVIK